MGLLGWGWGAMFQTPHFRSDSWMAASTRDTFPGSGTAIREAGCCVWGRHLIPGDLEAPSPPPICQQKSYKGGGNPYQKKKKKKKLKRKKKEGKKEKITLCFLLKSTKCNIYRYHIDLDPGRGGSGPVKHREGGRRGQFKAGKGAQKPPPQPSLNPAYDYQNGGCSQAYPSPIPSQAGVTSS